jgi:hypothetical protein
MARIYVTCRVFEDEIERLRTAGHDVTLRDAEGPIGWDELLENVGRADALICLLSDRVDAAVIERGSASRSSPTSGSATTTSTSPPRRSEGSSSPTPPAP